MKNVKKNLKYIGSAKLVFMTNSVTINSYVSLKSFCDWTRWLQGITWMLRMREHNENLKHVILKYSNPITRRWRFRWHSNWMYSRFRLTLLFPSNFVCFTGTVNGQHLSYYFSTSNKVHMIIRTRQFCLLVMFNWLFQ